MRYFPYKMLFLCIFLPPVCYILTLQLLEGYFQKQEYSSLNQIIVNDLEALYEGRYSVKEEINRNLEEYVSHDIKYKLGVRTHIIVKAGDDHILYPSQFKNRPGDPQQGSDFAQLPPSELNYVKMAVENYRILNRGLSLFVNVRIIHNGWLSNSILIFYVFLSLFILRSRIRKTINEAEMLDIEQKEDIHSLEDDLRRREDELKKLEIKEEDYKINISDLQKDKKDLSKDVDGLLEEIETLEKGLVVQQGLKEEMENRILQTREALDRIKGTIKHPRKKKKGLEAVNKRFKVLYKNLNFTDRALEGFFSLSDEFQLKAEEIIHRLNQNESQVSVRRKVFGKGGKMNVLEADFSYSGRIYFKKDFKSSTKIVAIGTKKTQQHDLAFMGSIK